MRHGEKAPFRILFYLSPFWLLLFHLLCLPCLLTCHSTSACFYPSLSPISSFIILLLLIKINHCLQLPHRKAEYTSLECGVSDAIKGKAAFIGDRDVTQSILHSHGYCAELRCGLGRLSLGIKYQRVVAFRKGSQYQQQINFK